MSTYKISRAGTSEIVRHFADCDLPIELIDHDPRRRSFWRMPEPATPGFIDVTPSRLLPRRTQHSSVQHFRAFVPSGDELVVLDKAPRRRHLLVMLRHTPETGQPVKQHLMLGHDERQLFVVGVEAVATLRDAFESLKPRQVQWVEQHGAKVIRQGDWFFTPLPRDISAFNYQETGIFYRNQSLGGPSGLRYGVRVGTPHIAEEQLVRIGDAYRRLGGEWRKVGRQIEWIVVRGKIRHAEHATIELSRWHFAMQNTGIAHTTIGYLD